MFFITVLASDDSIVSSEKKSAHTYEEICAAIEDKQSCVPIESKSSNVVKTNHRAYIYKVYPQHPMRSEP